MIVFWIAKFIDNEAVILLTKPSLSNMKIEPHYIMKQLHYIFWQNSSNDLSIKAYQEGIDLVIIYLEQWKQRVHKILANFADGCIWFLGWEGGVLTLLSIYMHNRGSLRSLIMDIHRVKFIGWNHNWMLVDEEKVRG